MTEQVPQELIDVLDADEQGELEGLRLLKSKSSDFEGRWPEQAARLRELESQLSGLP